MLDYALKYAAKGWPVFTIAPKTKKPYPGSHGFKDAATNEILVTRMWDEHPDADIAFATGKTAGAWVLDIDGEEGSRSLTTLEAELGPLPETLEQRSASGGRHLFFRWPAGGREVRNKQALLGHQGIDVRGDGGYVVLAPSGHPSGGTYSWPYGEETPIVDVPVVWLDAIAPAASQRRLAPWESPPETMPGPRPAAPGATPTLERARKYLGECEAAVQGNGGHDKLLWAARAMVIGFQLDDGAALSLLWSEYNPRCSPPWEQGSPSERRDFERKVTEARQTACKKAPGWLLDEYGLRSSESAMIEQLAAGNRFADALLGRAAATELEIQTDWSGEGTRLPFPINHFPAAIADYCRQMIDAHVVDASFVGLPMLAVAGAAMGNAWRLRLKKGFVVPPLIWVGIVGLSGSNKSGPAYEIVAPLHDAVPPEAIKAAMLNPQGRMVVSDATLEAVIARLGESHRGLLVFRDELAGWVKGFNAYKKSGGDEQAWLEFWGAKSYHLDRKTNNEQIHIHSAAVSVLGGLQPSVLAECFDPGRFASGFVPRILVTCPAPKKMYWSEIEVGAESSAEWYDAIMWLRSRPFVGLDPNTGQYQGRVLTLNRDAKALYVAFFNEMTDYIAKADNERAQLFASKARVQCARMILIHRGLVLAAQKSDDLDKPIGIDSALAGIEWMKWCLNEQMRIYSFAAGEHARQEADYLADLIRARLKEQAATVRNLMKINPKRYSSAPVTLAAMQQVVDLGLARWTEPKKKIELI